jgi:hypothetical protein
MRRRVSAILRDRSSPGEAINWAAPETPFGQSAAPGSHRSHYRIHVLASAERARALATIHSSNSRLVGVPADDRIRLGGNRRQLANETPLSPLEKWRLVIIHLRSTYANARFCTPAGQPWFRR